MCVCVGKDATICDIFHPPCLNKGGGKGGIRELKSSVAVCGGGVSCHVHVTCADQGLGGLYMEFTYSHYKLLNGAFYYSQ